MDWEVRYRGEQLRLLQLDDQADAGNAFVNLDYSLLAYELDKSMGLQTLDQTDADIHQQGLVQFQRGPLQMLSDIEFYQPQPPRDVADLALRDAQPETLKSGGNYPSFLRETAIGLLAILMPARRHVRFGIKALRFRKTKKRHRDDEFRVDHVDESLRDS